MRRERGVAAVTALLIVAVAASAATYMLAQQSAMLNQATLVANRAQADLYARAGLDWARGVLAQDFRAAGTVDNLNEGWAQPIAGLPIERALVAGQIVDEQGKLNLNNLVQGGVKSAPSVAILRGLLVSLELPPELSEAVVDWIDGNSDLDGTSGAEDSYYLSLARPYRAANQQLAQVEELHRIRGFTPERVAKLKPFVTALKLVTPVNANTAPPEVLAAILHDYSAAEVTAIITARRTKPFDTKGQIAEAAKKPAASISNDLDVKSRHFAASIRVALDDVQLATEALVLRGDDGKTTVLWRRPLY